MEHSKHSREESPIDPSVRRSYEASPFDPLASARMMGKFLGSLLSFDRKMNPLIMGGSTLVGGMFLVPGLLNGNVFSLFFGASLLLNVWRNLKRYYWRSIN